jgi:Pectate lyase superfamily protein
MSTEAIAGRARDSVGSGDGAKNPPVLGRKSVLMGMLASGFVVANAARPSAAYAGTIKPSPLAATQPAYAPRWTPSTSYVVGAQVVSPKNDVVSAKAAHTSSAAYTTDTAKWMLSSTYIPSTTGGTAPVCKGELVINVKDYGAVGDGATDDTAAIVAAINAATGGAPGAAPSPQRAALKPVYLPRGEYRITSQIKVLSVLNFVMFGDGSRQTSISVGASMTDALLFDGCPGLHLSDLRIIGYGGFTGAGAVSGSGVAVDYIPAQVRSWGTPATIDNVYVEELNFKYGFGIGCNTGASDLSSVSLTNCIVNGNRGNLDDTSTTYFQAGYKSGNGTAANVLNHQYRHCTGTYVRRLFHIDAVNTVSIIHGHASFLETALYVQSTGTTVYRDARIEETRRLVMTASGTANPANLTMENILYSPAGNNATDRQIIQWYYPGNVVLRNMWLDQHNGAVEDWLIGINNGGVATRQTNVIVDGLVTTNANATTLFLVGASSRCFVEVKGLVQANWSVGTTGTYVGRKVLIYNGATGDCGTTALST